MPLPWLEKKEIRLPPVEMALGEPNGLLAAGGQLSPEWLLCAYRQGIFPWFEAGQPILWRSPIPRLVLTPTTLQISKSLKKLLKKHNYQFSFDTSFTKVIQHCAESRRQGDGTWITKEMQAAYIELHEQGYAHSVEIWSDGVLVGGLYGVALGKVFFGESMFSSKSNTSKLALVYLTKQLALWDFELIDCQVSIAHLFTLGAFAIPRTEFLDKVSASVQQELPEANNVEKHNSQDIIGNWSTPNAPVKLQHEY